MEMRKLHMGTMSYGADSMDEVAHQLAVAFGSGEQSAFSFFFLSTIPTNMPSGHARNHSLSTGAQLATMGMRGRRDMSSRVRDVVLSLALCHNVRMTFISFTKLIHFQVTPVTNDDGSITYQASSPDEVAIVTWTQSIGLTLIFRDRTRITLQTPLGTEISYEILEIFPFTSESKRMGIVVRDITEGGSGEIMFLQKGADVVMGKIVQRNDWLEEETANMAREGLRTLVVGRKRLSQSTYSSFKSAYHAASITVTDDRNEAMQRVVSEYLEKDLELLGLTGVEDKLQDEVRPTLEILRNAGIKIWMLTGDKVETARCIAISTKLVARGQYIHEMAKRGLRHILLAPANVIYAVKTSEQIRDQLDFLQNKLDCCLVIDGESLQVCCTHFPSCPQNSPCTYSYA